VEVGFFETVARDLCGKGQCRLILQPVASLILGVRLGRADANANRIWRRSRPGPHPRTA